VQGNLAEPLWVDQRRSGSGPLLCGVLAWVLPGEPRPIARFRARSHTMSYGDEPRRPTLFNPRLLIALAIAVIGVVVYMSQTQVNPVTGKKQHIAMAVDQEKALGLQAAPKMAEEMGGRIDPARSPAARMVDDVGRR